MEWYWSCWHQHWTTTMVIVWSVGERSIQHTNPPRMGYYRPPNKRSHIIYCPKVWDDVDLYYHHHHHHPLQSSTNEVYQGIQGLLLRVGGNGVCSVIV